MNTELQAGGTLATGRLYVERPADKELLEALTTAEFCNVLAPRQIGKSSLRAHCQQSLAADGQRRCATIDLSSIGRTDLTTEQWFFGFLEQLSMALNVPLSPAEWRDNDDIGPVQRWTKFLRKMLDNVPEKIVVFIDEIDTLLALPAVSDDFFAALRAFYNNRADDPCYRRLTFCLLGVAAPWELIKDPTRTPFNIGRDIRLEDFTRRDIDAFASVLSRLGGDSAQWLDLIYHWTDGHPYFTQALCMKLIEKPRVATDSIEKHVERCIWERFLQGGSTGESNLSYAEKRLTQSENKSALLSLYRHILKPEGVKVNPTDPIHFELQLCGLCAQRQDAQGQRILRPRNLIFSTIFNLDWVKGKEVKRFLTESLIRWQDNGKRPNGLIRGEDLEDAQKWAQDNVLTREENEFLMASVAHARQEAESQRQASEVILEREKREHSERQSRTQRRITLGLAAASCLFLSLAALSYWEKRQAEAAEQTAKQHEDAARQAKEEVKKAAGDLATIKRQHDEINQQLSKIKDDLTKKESELQKTGAKIVETTNSLQQARNDSMSAKKLAKQDTEAYQKRIADLTALRENDQREKDSEIVKLKTEIDKLKNQRTCYEYYIKNARGAVYVKNLQKDCPLGR